MSLSTHIKNFEQGSITLIDGSAAELVVPYDGGDFAVSNLKKVLNEEVPYETRGNWRGSGHGNRVYPELKFSALFAELSNATAGVLTDWLLQRGGYAGVTSTAGVGRPLMCHLRYKAEGTSYGDDADSTMEFRNCHVMFEIAEDSGGGPTRFSLTATCRGDVLINGAPVMSEI